MVYYRKFRPQKISELDNEEIRNKLYSIFAGHHSSSIPHAFLFTGPKGLGKTSTARIIAKIINCEKRAKDQRQKKNDQIEPCNKCNQCVSITEGTNMDVLEIDAASNRGIDEIRDLREKIRLAPLKASKKIYIIDEVHMLTTEAFNALLKTLEEPPAHSVFILCTTEPQKVPATIFSRCFHIPFTLATSEELVRSFERIIKEEKINIDKEALSFIASLSDGSFRDGSKILEEMMFMVGRKKITKEMVEEKYQILNLKYQLDQILDFLAEKNTKKSLELVSKIVNQGMDIKYFIEQLINELHLKLLANIGIGNALEKRAPVSEAYWKLEEIKEIVELLGKAYLETKYAVLPQLPLEMAIIEWGEKNEKVELVGDSSIARGPAPTFPPASAPSHVRSATTSVRAVGSPSSRVTPASLHPNSNIWQELLAKIKPYNHSIAGVLHGCSLKSFAGKRLVIETKYKFHKEKLEEKKNIDLLEKIVQEITKKPTIISIVLR